MTTPPETLRFDTGTGISLAATAAGDAASPAVLLFHGGGQTRHAWGGAVDALASRGWRAVSFDLPGHGDSDWVADGDYSLDMFAGAVAGVAAQFDTPVLVGASLGGMASLTAIGEGLATTSGGLVLVDVTPRIEQAGLERIRAFMQQGVDGFDSLEDVAEAIASYTPNRKRRTDLDGLRKNVRLRDDGKWAWHWDPRFMTRVSAPGGEPTAGRLASPERLNDAAKHVTVPTLLVRGGSSDIVSEAGAAELKRMIPHAEIVDVAGAGHMVAGDRNDRFNDAVLDFLARTFP